MLQVIFVWARDSPVTLKAAVPLQIEAAPLQVAVPPLIRLSVCNVTVPNFTYSTILARMFLAYFRCGHGITLTVIGR